MNENDMAGQERMPVRTDEQRFQRSGCSRFAGCFIQQRIGEYKHGGVASTLMARNYKSATDIAVETEENEKPKRKYIVRRLTPTECARLQGFPDWWCDGADGSDSAQYKLWGNGIALPCAEDVIGRIARALREESER